MATQPVSAQSGRTVIDDFEDGDFSEYTPDPNNPDVDMSGVTVNSNQVHSGSSSLEIDAVEAEFISQPGDGLNYYPSAGDTFSVWFRTTGGANQTNFTYGVQDHENRYFLRFEVPNDKILLARADSNPTTIIDSNSTGFSLSEDAWYEAEIDWASDGTHTATIFDANGAQVAQVSGTDSTWTSGGIGFDAYLYASGETVWYDYASSEASSGGGGSSTTLVIDDFEDGDLLEYEPDPNNPDVDMSGVSVTSAQAKNGSTSLEFDALEAEMISTSGLEYYPEAGDTFGFWFRSTGGASEANFSYGVNGHHDRYYFKIRVPNDQIYLGKVDGGNSTVLESVSSGLSLSEDTWYRTEIDWASDGSHVITLYDASGSQLTQLSTTDSTWSSGGIGFDSYLYSSGEKVWFDYVTKDNRSMLGSFEDGLDSWEATGSSSLSQVSQSQNMAPITRGSSALDVSINGDSEPAIENQSRCREVDLGNYSCVLVDVLPANVQNSDSAVTFRFRYHHTDPGGVDESPEMTVSQTVGGCIAWDMSGLSDTKLASADRLELVWYPEDHPPSSGFDYNGQVYVDNVRVTDDHNEVIHAKCVRKERELVRTHGVKVDETVQSETNTSQERIFEYDDGTQVSHTIEVLGNGNIEEKVDGVTFVWERGSA